MAVNDAKARITMTGAELRAVADALDWVMRNPDPHVDYSALGKALDKVRNHIGAINYGRMVGELAL